MAFDWRMRSQPSFQKILREDDELPHRLEVAKSRNRPFIQFGMQRFAVIGVTEFLVHQIKAPQCRIVHICRVGTRYQDPMGLPGRKCTGQLRPPDNNSPKPSNQVCHVRRAHSLAADAGHCTLTVLDPRRSSIRIAVSVAPEESASGTKLLVQVTPTRN